MNIKIRRRPPNAPVNVEYLRYQIKHPEAEPRHILEEIVWQKELEVEKRRELTPLLELQKAVKDSQPPRDFLGALKAHHCPSQHLFISREGFCERHKRCANTVDYVTLL